MFGIRIGLHYSWFIIAFLIVFSLSEEFRIINPRWGTGLIAGMAVLTAVLFFVSLLLHELAHSLVAKTHDIPVKEITLFALGGVSQIEKNPVSAQVEFFMAFVGPLTSAVIGAIFWGVARLIGNQPPNPWVSMLGWLGYINIMLAVFNLIPGYPLDGGRVLRSLIWWKTGDADRSTQMAAKVGQVVAYLFILTGIFEYFGGAGIGGLWIAFIGWFLLQAARESYQQVGLAQALQGVRVADVMTSDCPTVDGLSNLQQFVEEDLLRTGRRCYVVANKGEVSGLVTLHEIKDTDRKRWPFMSVNDVMRPLEELHAVTPDVPLARALESMGRYDLNQLPVVSDSHLEGVVSRTQVLNYLQTHAELHR